LGLRALEKLERGADGWIPVFFLFHWKSSSITSPFIFYQFASTQTSLPEYGDGFAFSSFQDGLGQPSKSATCIIKGYNNAAKKKPPEKKGEGEGNEKEQNEK